MILITNVEKFAGHGTTRVALAQGATVLAHDPTFEAPSARRRYETQFHGAHALSATDPATMVELALANPNVHVQTSGQARKGLGQPAPVLSRGNHAEPDPLRRRFSKASPAAVL